jgi:RHS repeat-associated protein
VAVLAGLMPVLAPVVGPPAAVATSPATELVSANPSGGPGGGDGWSNRSDVSGDGRYVTLQWRPPNLVPGDTNGSEDVFVRDRGTGQTHLVSLSSTGEQGNGASAIPEISADGRYVAFESSATNLVPGDTNAHGDVFVRDLEAGRTVRASVDGAGNELPYGGNIYGYSDDGRHVLFYGFDKLRVWDMGTGRSTPVADDAFYGAISADGNLVVYDSDLDDIVPGDDNEVDDVFLVDVAAGETTRISVPPVPGPFTRGSFEPSISGDGRYISFESYDAYVPEDTGDDSQLYVHDRVTGTTTLASANAAGEPANGFVSWARLSGDGRYLSYDTNASNLVPGDTNDDWDIFVKDRLTGQVSRASVGPAGGQADDGSGLASISADGQHVSFFSSAHNLTASQIATPEIYVHGPPVPPAVSRPWLSLLGIRLSSGYASDPVNTAIGNFVQQVTDLPFAEGVFGLDWARGYNSLDATPGALGIGWVGAFAATVNEQANGEVILRDNDGRVVTFHPNGTGGYDRPEEIFGDLVRNPDGSFALRYRSGATAEFDTGGRLARRSNWDGQVVTLAHAGDRLTTATSSTGRSLVFTYDTAGMLTKVAADDGRSVAYTYQDGALRTATDPGGSVTTYETDTAGRITRIVGADGNPVLTNVYDDRGRVDRQTTPAGDQVDFAYDDTAHTTTVTNQATAGSVAYQHDAQGHLTDITDPYGARLSKRYDAAGNLASVTDRRGAEGLQEFDARGNLTERTLPGGLTETYGYDAADRLVTATDDAGVATTFTYEGSERLPTTVTRGGGTSRFEVQDGLVRSVEDPDGVSRSLTWDGSRNLTKVTQEGGGETSYIYDAAGRPTSVTVPGGARTTYAYDAAGRLASETNAAGGVTTYSYDVAGRRASVTTPVGARTAYAYDTAGRLASETSPTGAVTAYSYDAAGRPTTVTRPGSAVTTLTYNKLGALLTAKTPTGALTTNAYDADGNLVSATDPTGGTATSTVDALGRVTEQKDALGRTTRFEYDAEGRRTATVDPTGARTTSRYDANGNLVETVDPRGATTTRRFSPAGRLLEVEDPLGHKTTYGYDPAGRLTAVTDPNGKATTFSYDGAGRRASETTPTGARTSYAYNAAGWATKVTDSSGGVTTTTYDKAGHVQQVTSPTGTVRKFTYDKAGRLTKATDANGAVTTYAYDGRGNLIRRTNPNLAQETWSYSKDDLTLSYTDGLGRKTTFAYDKSGRRTKTTDPSGRSTTLAFDKAGQLLSRTYGDGTKVSFTYDGAGRLASMADPTGTTAYEYDAAGNPTRVTSPGGKVIGYAYDPAGRRTRTTYPDASTATSTYDAVGRLATVTHSTAGSASFAYDADGRLLSEQLPGGMTRTYRYTTGRMTGFEEAGSPNARSTDLTYDAAGRVSTETTGGVTRRFTYDAAGQLLRAQVEAAGGEDLQYTYDKVGNRLTQTRDGSQRSYSYDAANQLASSTLGGATTTYTYDAAGRRVQEAADDRTRTIDYDARGLPAKVSSATAAGTHIQTRTYSGDGALASVTDDDGATQRTTSLVWDRSASVPQVAALTTAGTETDLVYGSGRAFAVGDGAAAAFSRDVYGSALRTDGTAALVRAGAYDPYGIPTGSSGHSPVFGYRGELDLDGLLYLRARDYDPSTGGFTTTDPLDGRPGDVTQTNPYPYAANDPVNQIDPLGEHPIADGELKLVGLIGWPFGKQWWDRQSRQFHQTQLMVRGFIDPNCIEFEQPCYSSRGFEAEDTAVAHAIRELSNRRQGWFGWPPWDPVDDAVQWEVGLTDDSRGEKADLVVDDDPTDPDADLYEAKVWKGSTRTFAEVAAQLAQYQVLASDRGLAWRSGRELSDSNWAVAYYGHPSVLSERLFLDAPIWYAWAPYPGHIYAARKDDTPSEVRARARYYFPDLNWVIEELGIPSLPGVRTPVPAPI